VCKGRSEILVNSTHTQLLKNNELILPSSLLCYTRPETSITAASPGPASKRLRFLLGTGQMLHPVGAAVGVILSCADIN